MNAETQMIVRKAVVIDVPAIGAIVNYHAGKGIMLQRPLSRIYENVRDYMVLESGGEIVGCGALHVMWDDLAEIRAVALKEEYIGKGFGRRILEALLDDAKSLGVRKVFVLTYSVELFRYLGFSDIDKSELPHKIWSDCLNCVHFPDCDESALMRSVE